MALLRWIVALPIIIGVVLFAMAHPEFVEITWSPLHDSLNLPLYAVVLLFLGVGFLLGAFIAWINFLPAMHDRRALRKKVRAQEKEINEANEKLIAELSKPQEAPYTSISNENKN